MKMTPLIPAFHAVPPTRTNCYLLQWMDWRRETVEALDILYWEYGSTPCHQPASTANLHAWSQGLIRRLPRLHPFDHAQLQAACMRFFAWGYRYTAAPDTLLEYTERFIDLFPELKDGEVNLRDAHFITWFIQHNFDLLVA